MPSALSSKKVSSRGFTPRNREDIRLFEDSTFLLTKFEYEGEEPDTLVKQALVMVEGEHTDSAKRKHVFDRDRVIKLAENTNAFLESGGRVPWQRDHSKKQEDNIGDLEGLLEVRVITAKDVPDRRLLKKLVGKVGAFATRLVAKGQDVIEQIKAGRINTLSPGIDVLTDTIREISATPTPAIVGLRTFRRHGEGRSQESEGRRMINSCIYHPSSSFPFPSSFKRDANFALTFEQAEAESADLDAIKDSYNDLTKTFWQILTSITTAAPEELGGQDPTQLQYQAVDDLAQRLVGLLGLEEADGAEGDGTQGQAQTRQRGTSLPQYLPKQQQDTPPGGEANMSAYTMADMAAQMYGYGQTAEFARRRGSRNRRRRGRKGGGAAGAVLGRTTAGRLARVAGLGLVAGGGAAAIRYGGAGQRASAGIAAGMMGRGAGRRAALGTQGRYFVQGAQSQLASDVGAVRLRAVKAGKSLQTRARRMQYENAMGSGGTAAQRNRFRRRTTNRGINPPRNIAIQ